ncbi:MAG TPA: MFS transporter [Cellulomonas sp.]
MSTQHDERSAEALVTATPDEPARKPAPLGHRFTALLASTAFANLGDGVIQTGAPLIAITLTRSPGQVSLLSAAAWLPWLVLGIAGGVLVDRSDRRHAQMSALVARSVLLAGACALTVAGHLTMPMLLVVVLLYGVTAVIAELGETSIVPDLVSRDRLPAANGRVLAVQQVANVFLGSPAAGALLTLGAWSVLGVPAALAVGAALCLLVGVPGRYRHESSPADADRGALGEVRDGLAFLLKHPVLRPQLWASGLFNMGSTAYMAVIVLWMVGDGSRMGLKPVHYTLLMTLFAVGAVAGSVIAERIIHRVGEVRLLVVCFLLDSLLLLVPLLAPHPGPVAVALLLLGATGNVGNVITQSIRQRLVPKHMLGRISGAGRTFSYGLMPLGAIVGGVVGESLGLPASLLTGTALCLAATAVLAARVRQRDVDAAELAPDEELSPAAGA